MAEFSMFSQFMVNIALAASELNSMLVLEVDEEQGTREKKEQLQGVIKMTDKLSQSKMKDLNSITDDFVRKDSSYVDLTAVKALIVKLFQCTVFAVKRSATKGMFTPAADASGEMTVRSTMT